MNKKSIEFSNDELDILSEFINISFGLAASIIGDMINSYAHLHVPNVKLIKMNKLYDILFQHKSDEKLFYTKQRVMGTFEGEILFSIESNAAYTFTQLLHNSKEKIDINEISGATLELTNIITSACMGKFAELVKGEIIFSTPAIEENPKKNLLYESKSEEYSHVILITTSLDIEEKNIWGQMYIMLNDSMVLKLKEMLKKFL